MIIGVDPGLASTGYALVGRRGSRLVAVAHGTLRTDPRTPHAERLAALHDGIAALISAHAPAGAASRGSPPRSGRWSSRRPGSQRR